jgi:hypothetical protein
MNSEHHRRRTYSKSSKIYSSEKIASQLKLKNFVTTATSPYQTSRNISYKETKFSNVEQTTEEYNLKEPEKKKLLLSNRIGSYNSNNQLLADNIIILIMRIFILINKISLNYLSSIKVESTSHIASHWRSIRRCRHLLCSSTWWNNISFLKILIKI